MIRIEIINEGSKTVIEREEIHPVTALDDLLNILFISGFELEDIREALQILTNPQKNNHKNESKDVQNTCSI